MQDYAPLIENAFLITPGEYSYVVEEIEGEIPDFVRGSYYLNGPARFSRGGFRYNHWLDGDGMVCGLRFENGGVRFTNRFVRGTKFVAEEKAGRPIFRTFGTGFETAQLKRGVTLASPLNISVYPYRDMLLAFGEQGLPYELDPITLETRGEFSFGGSINDISPFAAHPKFDPITGEMFNFGIAYSAANPHLNLYCFRPDGELIYRKRISLDCARSAHDFGVSQNYAIFYLCPYILNMKVLARNGHTLMDAFNWEPERGSYLLIVSRKTGEQVATIPVGNKYCLHLINCFETERCLTVDVLELEHPIYGQYQVLPNLFTDVCEGQPRRFVIDMNHHELLETVTIDYQAAPDFPSIAPKDLTQPYRDFWMLGISATGNRGRKFFDQLVHANWADARGCDVYQTPGMEYLGGEPIFIGAPNCEGCNVVLCQIFDAQRLKSAFAIFNADNVSAGPIAKLWLKAPIHLGFHASFLPSGDYGLRRPTHSKSQYLLV